MKKTDIARAWKDEEYYLSLTEEQRRELPASPVGTVELADSELHGFASAAWVSGAPCTTHPSFGSFCYSC